MALDIGASPFGNWSGCHACEWDYNAPEFDDLAVGDGFQKHSYQLGIMVNASGRRFVDEGADIRNYTYAKSGRSEEHTSELQSLIRISYAVFCLKKKQNKYKHA